eukprot:3528232-Rhodomonas_salina.1
MPMKIRWGAREETRAKIPVRAWRYAHGRAAARVMQGRFRSDTLRRMPGNHLRKPVFHAPRMWDCAENVEFLARVFAANAGTDLAH